MWDVALVIKTTLGDGANRAADAGDVFIPDATIIKAVPAIPMSLLVALKSIFRGKAAGNNGRPKNCDRAEVGIAR
jgi:hypothetical protein